MSRGYYVLDGHVARPTKNLMEWGRAFEDGEARTVGRTKLSKHIMVSTVFIGLDHQWEETGPPLIFETLVFGGPLDGEMERYSTWDQAQLGHDAMIARVKAAVDDLEGKCQK